MNPAWSLEPGATGQPLDLTTRKRAASAQIDACLAELAKQNALALAPPFCLPLAPFTPPANPLWTKYLELCALYAVQNPLLNPALLLQPYLLPALQQQQQLHLQQQSALQAIAAMSGAASLSPRSDQPNSLPHPESSCTRHKCVCGKTFERLYDLTIHMENEGHAGLDTNSNQPRKFVRGQDLWIIGKNKEETEKIMSCLHCNKSFKSLPELTVHMKVSGHFWNIAPPNELKNAIRSAYEPAPNQVGGESVSSQSDQPAGAKEPIGLPAVGALHKRPRLDVGSLPHPKPLSLGAKSAFSAAGAENQLAARSKPRSLADAAADKPTPRSDPPLGERTATASPDSDPTKDRLVWSPASGVKSRRAAGAPPDGASRSAGGTRSASTGHPLKDLELLLDKHKTDKEPDRSTTADHSAAASPERQPSPTDRADDTQ